MIVNDILDLARAETHTTATQFANATLITWLNIIYHKLLRKIMTEADENYFTTFKEIDAVADQDSYSLGTNLIYVKQVKVLPTASSADYAVSHEMDFSKQQYDFDYYADNQPTDYPVHQISGTTLFVAPKFTSSTAGSAGNKQIYVEYEPTQNDLAVGGAEATIAVPVDFHYVLAKGLKPMIYSALGKLNEKNDAVAEFKDEVNEMLYLLRGRDDTANYFSIPNDTDLE